MINEPFMKISEYAIADPYPLVTEDSNLWAEMLTIAHDKNRYLFGILTWIRAVGARLEKTNNPAMPYKIVPIIANENCKEGWSSMEEWEREKQNLNPFVSELIEVLRQL